jgi:hypothetical protein
MTFGSISAIAEAAVENDRPARDPMRSIVW